MKKSSMPQNVLIIDSDYDEARDFVKGLRETTHEKWKVALHENNKTAPRAINRTKRFS